MHCYRMLGSFEDAEDALQNTLLTAWQSLGGFEGRASLRTGLYRIATHRCLDARRAAGRRPAKAWDGGRRVWLRGRKRCRVNCEVIGVVGKFQQDI